MLYRYTLILLLGFLFNTALTNCGHCQKKNDQLHQLFRYYDQENIKFDPISATLSGNHSYDDQVANEGTIAYRTLKDHFCEKYLKQLLRLNRRDLNLADRISFDVLKERLIMDKESRNYPLEYLPVNQFSSLPLTMAQLGSGDSGQPFKTVKDYMLWLKRITAFTVWTDTAIANMKRGISKGIVLPKALVLQIIPQMQSLAETDTSKNLFFMPVRKFPVSFTGSDKEHLRSSYLHSITTELIPAYQRLADFFKNDYLPHATDSAGLSGLPGGTEIYKYYVRLYTTTKKTPEEIYQTGLSEVARIRNNMEKIRSATGFKGSLNEFFTYLRTDRKFMPFKTPEEVLQAYAAIYSKVEPHLDQYFSSFPKTPFEIRRVEAYREASQNGPSYMVGSLKDKRPGIFYVPVTDPAKINVTFLGLEATFIHEAIPGHHFQISLQQENKHLPEFRKSISVIAFLEGWGLYVESLGKELGCYTDPYQEMGALNNELHRAIRLVTDVGIHMGKMSKEEAVKYMTDNEPISKTDAVLSAERYMAMPGQALAYKIGEIEIVRIREKCRKISGKRFDIRKFHNALLAQGDMPLTALDSYMTEWAEKN